MWKTWLVSENDHRGPEARREAGIYWINTVLDGCFDGWGAKPLKLIQTQRLSEDVSFGTFL